MGAYENPPMIQFATSSAGNAWANAAAAAGKNIGDAIIARQKKLEERLEKENKQMLEIGKKRAALAQEGQKLIDQQLAKMEGLDDALKKAYVNEFRQGWKTFTEVQVATDPAVIERLQPQLAKFENFRANSNDSLMVANELYSTLTGDLSEVADKQIAIPGMIDQFDPRNNYLMDAAAIENGGITGKEKREVSFNDNGETIITYTNADGVKLDPINFSAPPTTNKVPKLEELFQPRADATGIFVGEGKDKSISTDYMAVDATGKPKMLYEFEDIESDPSGRKRQIIRKGPEVRNNDIIQIYTDQVESLGLTDDQKVSIYKNILVDQFQLDPEALSYNPKGATQLDEPQQKIFNDAISKWAGTKANNDVASVTKKLGGSETIVTYPKKDMSSSTQNAIDGFKLLQSGEITNLGVSGGYISKKGDKYTFYKNTTTGPIPVLENASLEESIRMVSNIPQSEVIAVIKPELQ